MKTVILDGYRFTLSKGKKYHYNSTLRKSLHQYLWEKENGTIPDGYEIHHIDGDSLNNDMENLQILTMVEHKAIHKEWLNNDPERLERMRVNLEKNARPKASEWHGSKEGLKWHTEHYENMKHLLHEEVECECEQCGVKYVAKVGNNRFCSNKCRSKWRRVSGVDDVERVCVTCGKVFIVNKYTKTENCSKVCASKYRWKKRKDSLDLQE